MSFMYKSMGAKHSKWQLSQNNQYVSYALLSLGAEYLINTLYQLNGEVNRPICFQILDKWPRKG